MRLGKDFEAIFDMKAKQDSAQSMMARVTSAKVAEATAELFEFGYSMVINSFFVKIKSVNYFIFNYNIFKIR